jgi:GT2 family glycosyltransferase
MVDIFQTVGLVAIGRNEGERLQRCLLSVPQGIPVVYVDSASTDSSVAFAKSTNANVVELDMTLPFTAARARNEGLERLQRNHPGISYVQFVDGDCEMEPEWFSVATAFLSANNMVAAVCGRRRERYPNASFYNRMCDDEWNTPVGQTKACGGDAMMRITALTELGGYDATMIAGEEPELCQRLRSAGWQIWRLDAAMTVHDADMHRFGQWWKRAVRSGFGYAQVYNKTNVSGGDQLYRRELLSALFWTIGIISVALLCGLAFGLLGLAFAPVIWAVQLIRLSFREGAAKGFHLLFGKIAETQGIVHFYLGQLLGRTQGAIF